jgi:hypothetical protein
MELELLEPRAQGILRFVGSGNILITGSITSVVIGLTWGGVRYPWSSSHVLVPLIFGFVGLILFVIYEFYLCKPPVVSSFSKIWNDYLLIEPLSRFQFYFAWTGLVPADISKIL